MIILIGSFMLIFLAALVVKAFYGDEQLGSDGRASNPRYSRQDGNNPGSARAPTFEAGADSGVGLRWEARDPETHRLRTIYILPSWRKRDDGSYVVYNPCIEMRQENGQRVYITADEAVLYVEEVAGGVRVLGGRVYSTDRARPRNVRIYLDRATEGVRPSFTELGDDLTSEDVFAALDDRREDMIRIFVEDMSIDQDLLEINTDNSVVVFSAEADIIGEGLTLRWNESPGELRLLRIKRGRSIHVYNIPAEVNLIAMPGEEEAEIAPDGDHDESADDEPNDRADFGPAQPGDAAETTAASQDPAEAPASADAEPESADAQDAADAEQPRQNIYLAEFHDNVSVDSGSRRLWGADRLTLQFEWGGRAEEGLRERLSQPTDEQFMSPELTEPSPNADDNNAASGAAGRTADRSARDPEDANVDSGGTGDSQDQPEQADAEAIEPVIIMWQGELNITPIGYTPEPSTRRYVVTAVGNNVHLEDPQASASCQVAVFRNPERTGELRGSVDMPATLYLAGGQEIISPEVSFDLPAGKVNMAGPGMIIQARGTPSRQLTEAELSQIGALSDAGSISWRDRAEATFGTARVTLDDGTIERRQYIEDAIFFEDVVLTQGPPDEALLTEDNLPAGDFLRCDIMRVWMTANNGQKVVPESAVAKGNVIARQGSNLIHAGVVDVFFDEVEEIDDDGEVVTRLRPSLIVAKNGVTITDYSDPDQPIEARADRVQSDVLARMAVLFGGDENAEIVQGQRRLAGMEIHLDQNMQSAIVIGPGHMRLFTDRDMNGNPLSSPRPVDITWQDGMEYYGKRNDANFIGSVELVSEMDYMACRQLRVLFERSEPTEQEAADELAAADDSRGSQLGLNIERYSGRRLSMIMAFNDVIVRSRRENDEGELLGRLQMTGERLMYDMQAEELSIFGEGTLVVEDYDVTPEDGQPRTRADAAGNPTLQSPSQTAFLWTREMQLLQADRQVRLKGDVQMIHRSGDQVAVMPGLRVPDWEQLDSGRRSSLRCEDLFAEFAPPSDMPEGELAATDDMWQSGPRLGPLELFTAYRRVNMIDGPVQIVGEQLVYNRRNGSAVVLGFLEGEPIRDASLMYEGQSWSSPKMTIEIRDGQITKVYTERVVGSGAVLPRE